MHFRCALLCSIPVEGYHLALSRVRYFNKLYRYAVVASYDTAPVRDTKYSLWSVTYMGISSGCRLNKTSMQIRLNAMYFVSVTDTFSYFYITDSLLPHSTPCGIHKLYPTPVHSTDNVTCVVWLMLTLRSVILWDGQETIFPRVSNISSHQLAVCNEGRLGEVTVFTTMPPRHDFSANISDIHTKPTLLCLASCRPS